MRLDMKKYLHLILAAVAACIIFAACATADSSAMPDAQTIADALLNQSIFDETLSPLPEDEISYYVTMEEGVTGLMYLSDGSTAEEVAVFQAPDKNTAAKMLTNVEEYLSAQKSSFADYLPEEAKRIDDAVLIQKGNCVVLCVSGQSDAAKRVIEDVFVEQ
jgi:hypothetical protein